MADVIPFPDKKRRHGLLEPGFSVRVVSHEGLWLVVARKHSWIFCTRREAQAFARDLADGFGVSVVIQMRGAA